MIKPLQRSSNGRRRRAWRRFSVPVLPSILTAGNLACGVTAILCAASSKDLLFAGAVLVFVAMIADMLDGKVARLTGGEGEFGAELDSLADVVSFGVAPAMLVHRIVLGEHPGGIVTEGERFIWLVAVLYAVMTALRLARYNVEHRREPTRAFRGLPSPGAAAFLCSWVMYYAWFSTDDRFATDLLSFGMSYETWSTTVKSMLMVFTVLVGFLMVSNVRFPHVGNTLLGDRVGFRRLILLILALGFLVVLPLYCLIMATSAYVVLGLAMAVPSLVRRWSKGRDIIEEEDDDGDDTGAYRQSPEEESHRAEP